MQVRAFEEWFANRTFTLPDDEEAELKRRLLHAKARELVTAVKKMRLVQAQQRARHAAYLQRLKALEFGAINVISSSAVANRGGDGIDDEDETAMPRQTLADIPAALRVLIFHFVPVVSDRFVDDMRQVNRILSLQDGEVLREPERAQRMVDVMQDCVRVPHVTNVGDFAVIARSMGLDRVAANLHPQRVEYCRLISSAVSELRFMEHRLDSFARWTEFRVSVMATPCSQLRTTLREDLVAWRDQIRKWGRERRDVMFELAASEHEYLWRRCKAVEFVGDPALELDDVRNMFWECNLKVPEGITADYTQSITVSQAITLGIADLPWVRGYTWEDRPAPIDEDELCTDSQPASARSPAPLLTSASATIVSTASGDRVLRLMSQKAMNAAAKQQQADMERERYLAEQEQYVMRQRAWHVAADGMTQRLWMTTQQFRHRWHHRFCGCEICASLPIHHVGLKKENSGAPDDIALCETCFGDLYSDENSVANRMYTWYVVRDLIDNPAEPPVPPQTVLAGSVNDSRSNSPTVGFALTSLPQALQTPLSQP